MRQFLVALVVLLGAGVSHGQTPVTYSEAAGQVMQTISGLNTARVEEAITLHQVGCTPSFAFNWVPVEWVTTENVEYTGQWRNENNCAFVNDNILRFYQGYCETLNRVHCGRLKRGNRPFEAETEARTGTSLDEWWDWETVEPEGWDFGPTSPPTGPWGPGPSGVEFSCASMTGRFGWSSMSYPDSWNPELTIYAITRQDPGGGWSLVGSGDSSGLISSNAAANINGICRGNYSNAPRPSLRDWHEGKYYVRQQGPLAPFAQEHPDLVEGMKVVWTELLAENDRIGYEGLAIAGQRFDPLPTPEELNQGEGLPGEGGGGEEIDPGTCEDGWILTRAVCIIRDQGQRLWAFISHDAWVPTTDWGQEFSNLRTTAETRFPFNMLNATSFLGGNWEQSEELACADIEVVVPNVMDAGGQTVGAVNLCDSVFAEAAHNYFRPALIVFIAFMMMIGLYNRTLGAL